MVTWHHLVIYKTTINNRAGHARTYEIQSKFREMNAEALIE